MRNLIIAITLMLLSFSASATTKQFCLTGTVVEGTYESIQTTIQYTDATKSVIQYIDDVGADGRTYRVTPVYAATSDTFICPIRQ